MYLVDSHLGGTDWPPRNAARQVARTVAPVRAMGPRSSGNEYGERGVATMLEPQKIGVQPQWEAGRSHGVRAGSRTRGARRFSASPACRPRTQREKESR